jgi:biotin carboxylase
MQGPAINIAKELGFFTVVLDGSRSAPCIELADQFEQIDLKDKEGIETFARSLQNLGGIMTAGTDFSASVAWAAEKLGLPGIPYEAALNASDKSRMRACFKKAGLPSPEYTTIGPEILLDEALLRRIRLPEVGLPSRSCAGTGRIDPETPLEGVLSLFPLVVKPVDNMGGRGCRRVDSAEEFRAAAAAALSFSRSGRAIAEAFMDGPEFSVDAIVYRSEITVCGLADRHIYFPPYFIEMGHTMPTDIDREKQEAILDTFCRGVRSLGLAGQGSVGAAKGDIKLTSKGPMIGEIAARLSGGYMSGWTYPYSSGVEPIRAAVLMAMGRVPDRLSPVKNQTSAERAFISIPGAIKAIHGLEAARAADNVKDLFLRVSEGSKVNFPENNVSKCGNIISAAPDRNEAVEAAESAARSILIRLDPDDTETAEFLERHSIFPPDAYQIGEELRAALEKLPETLTAHEWPGKGEIYLYPFHQFTAGNLVDYMGRSVEESLEALRILTGLSLSVRREASDNKCTILGRSFWAALIRGGYQGAVYYSDQLRKNE